MKRFIFSAMFVLLGTIGLFFAIAPAAAGKDDGAWGTIKGQVVLDADAVPDPKTLNIDKDQNHCLSKGPILSEVLVVNKKNKGVRWVFVWLEPEAGDPPLKVHPNLMAIKVKQVEVDQPCCQFIPHALALREGQVLVAKNSAPIAHNINWTGGSKNPGDNVIIQPGGSVNIGNLVADKYPVKFQCNIHAWMGGWVRVFDHPYFALTDENGKFEIKQAPAGTYRVRGWQEGVGYVPDRKGIAITIKGNEVTDTGDIKMKPPDDK
jgi:hypothetical protein